MTERERCWAPRLVVAFALILFCWTHRHTLQLNGFADDLGLLAELPQRATDHSLRGDMLSRFTNPLWPGSTMWRPIPYASFGLDALIWGRASGYWHLINLALHLGSATLTGLIAARLTAQRLAGAAAFATFLLMPWVAEVTQWLVGRFDGWATLAVLATLWAALKSRGADRWLLASLAAAAVAYMSKESALVIPLWLVLLAMLPGTTAASSLALRHTAAATHRRVASERLTTLLGRGRYLIVAHLLLAAAYVAWRSRLFSAAALSVYASPPEYRPLPLLDRVLAHLAFPAALAPLASTAAAVAGVLAIGYVFVAMRSPARWLALMAATMVLSVVVAVAVHFANPPGAGDGYRLYYLAAFGIALIVAAGVNAQSKTSLLLLVGFMIALAAWQSRVVAEWTRASRAVGGASEAMADAARTFPSGDFGLVLLPDALGHVPVARNAQGALLAQKPGGPIPRNYFIVFTPPQLAEWYLLSGEDVVKKLTPRADAPPRPTRYFCFDTRRQTLEDLGYWPNDSEASWIAKWREKVSNRCPDMPMSPA